MAVINLTAVPTGMQNLKEQRKCKCLVPTFEASMKCHSESISNLSDGAEVKMVALTKICNFYSIHKLNSPLTFCFVKAVWF